LRRILPADERSINGFEWSVTFVTAFRNLEAKVAFKRGTQ
jgi:hypothetical protein